jgi:hypothetical protein
MRKVFFNVSSWIENTSPIMTAEAVFYHEKRPVVPALLCLWALPP